MSLLVLCPLLAAVLCSVFAGTILARDPRDFDHRLAAAMIGGVTVWSCFEVLWQVQTNPAMASLMLRATAIGWVWLPTIFLHLTLRNSVDEWPRLRAVVPACYGVSAFVLGLAFTPWMLGAVAHPSGRWIVVHGPLQAVPMITGMLGCGTALIVGRHSYRSTASPAERAQMRWLGRGVAFSLCAVIAFDVMLPVLGQPSPRIGSLAFSILTGMTAWSFQRYGYSYLAPGTLAREILETLPEGVAMLRQDGRVRSANGSLAKLLGCQPGDELGLSLAEQLTDVPSTPLADFEAQRCNLRTFSGEKRPVEVSSAVLRDRPGNAIGLVVVIRDLTEVESLRNRLILSGRLAAVGELAAGIAHEINNPLTFVRANLDMLRQHWQSVAAKLANESLPEPVAQALAEGEELMDESLEGVDRAVAIVRDVRGLAHGGGGEWVIADVHELLDGVLRMANPELRGRATVEKHYGAGCSLECAPQELQQVFLNLVLNAGHAVEPHGTIRVTTAVEGGEVVVSVADDGCGIDPDARDRIFDPFFTTKPVGEGTGLGLSIAFGIVESHGGNIRVEPAADRGTVFIVRLPIAG